MFKKTVSLFLVIIAMLVFGTISAFADEKGMNYLYTLSCYSSLTVSGMTGTCTSSISCTNTTTKIEITQTLQVRDGNQWRTSKQWKKTVYGYVYDLINTRTLYTGNTYRVKSEFKVYCGSNSETIYAYSYTRTV